MKKRGAALLFCLLLVLQLAVPVRAAGSVYFVAAEASVLPLTDATMPFWSGGYLYFHAEANAIISASRRDMVGGTIYLVGRNAATGELLPDATSCLMCRRMVINAGLERVVIRRTKTEFEVVPVETWIAEDDLMTPENVVMDLK